MKLLVPIIILTAYLVAVRTNIMINIRAIYYLAAWLIIWPITDKLRCTFRSTW